jgi:hypothetical protein
MKNLFIIGLLLSLFSACNTTENDNSSILPIAAENIQSIVILGNEVTVTTIYGTATPCCYYYKSENTNDGNVFTSKVFGKYDGEPCVEMIGSFKRVEQIVFQSKGIKTLRFWQNDSTYLDTTITLP